MTFFRTLALLSAVLFLFSCAAGSSRSAKTEEPTSFSRENIVKLRVGMTSEEVVEIFGLPLKTEANVCGETTASPWTCITWWYNSKSLAQSTRMVFEVHNETLYLNRWVTN
jgi:hypothetical protein